MKAAAKFCLQSPDDSRFISRSDLMEALVIGLDTSS